MGQLIRAHIDVARNIARALARRFAWMLERDDIDSAAMVGLCEAAARFDPKRVEPFVAFAEQRIRGAVLDEIRRLGAHGRATNERHRRIAAARRRIAQAGQAPTDERVAKQLGLSLATIQDTGSRNLRVGVEAVATLAAPGGSPETYVQCAQYLVRLSRARTTLPAREEAVIRLRYDVGMSLPQIARALGITLARVRRIHSDGLAALRGAVRDDERSAKARARSRRAKLP